MDIGFLTVKRVGQNDYFTRFERHYFTNGNLTIENKCFHSQDPSDIGQTCSLEEVPEWATINPGPVIYPGMQQMDFDITEIRSRTGLTDQHAEYLFLKQPKDGSGKQIFRERAWTGNMIQGKGRSMSMIEP